MLLSDTSTVTTLVDKRVKEEILVVGGGGGLKTKT